MYVLALVCVCLCVCDYHRTGNHSVRHNWESQSINYGSNSLYRVGILGEPRHLFNPHTLLPLESEENGKQSGRNSSIIERNNAMIEDTLDLVMTTLSSQSAFPK